MAVEWSRLTRHAKRAVFESRELAASLAGSTVQPDHLVISLMEDSSSAASVLLALSGAPQEDLRILLEERVAEQAQLESPVEEPAYSTALRQVVEQAGALAETDSIGSEHLLMAALAPGTSLGDVVLEQCGVDGSALGRCLAALQQHELSLRAGGKPGERTVSARSAPAIQSNGAAPVQGSAPATAPSAPPPATSHTLMALARLVVDLSGKAASAARSAGNEPLADQLDRMRREVEAQIGTARGGSPTGVKSA